jgi:hypothetical protein
MFHVVLEEVPLTAMGLVFSLPRAFCEYTIVLWLSSYMVVVPLIGSSKISPELAEVDALLGGVRCLVIFSLTRVQCDTCQMLGLVADWSSA